MGIVAVVVAAIGGFAVGAAWYMTLADQWMAAIGKTKEEIEADKDPTPFVIAGLGALLSAALMYHMFAAAGITGTMRCLAYGAGIGAFIAAPWIILHYAFAGRPRSLWWIDGGHTIAAFAVMGLILGFFL